MFRFSYPILKPILANFTSTFTKQISSDVPVLGKILALPNGVPKVVDLH